jgi:hypothetical protein
MSTLSALKLTAAKRSTGISPQVQRRLKLVKKIDDQIALAKALSTGGTYTTSRFRTIKDDEGGSRSIEIQKKVRPWWFPTETGKIALSIRYGARVVEISKGKTAIEVASGDDLINALSVVRKAVDAGELDTQIETASIKLREGFGK